MTDHLLLPVAVPSPTGAGSSKNSSRTHREDADERAHIEHKIEIVTSDPDLTAEEKAAAIAELRRALE